MTGAGATLWTRPGEAQNAWRLGYRCGPRPSPDDPPIGQRIPPVCQGQTGQAAGPDALAHRGGPVDGVHPPFDEAVGAQSRPRHPGGCGHARGYASNQTLPTGYQTDTIRMITTGALARHRAPPVPPSAPNSVGSPRYTQATPYRVSGSSRVKTYGSVKRKIFQALAGWCFCR
jgi:hypothetical protein